MSSRPKCKVASLVLSGVPAEVRAVLEGTQSA
jgi:hypothetical protein